MSSYICWALLLLTAVRVRSPNVVHTHYEEVSLHSDTTMLYELRHNASNYATLSNYNYIMYFRPLVNPCLNGALTVSVHRGSTSAQVWEITYEDVPYYVSPCVYYDTYCSTWFDCVSEHKLNNSRIAVGTYQRIDYYIQELWYYKDYCPSLVEADITLHCYANITTSSSSSSTTTTSTTTTMSTTDEISDMGSDSSSTTVLGLDPFIFLYIAGIIFLLLVIWRFIINKKKNNRNAAANNIQQIQFQNAVHSSHLQTQALQTVQMTMVPQMNMNMNMHVAQTQIPQYQAQFGQVQQTQTQPQPQTTQSQSVETVDVYDQEMPQLPSEITTGEDGDGDGCVDDTDGVGTTEGV